MPDTVFDKRWRELEALDQSSLPRLHLCFVQAAKEGEVILFWSVAKLLCSDWSASGLLLLLGCIPATVLPKASGVVQGFSYLVSCEV